MGGPAGVAPPSAAGASEGLPASLRQRFSGYAEEALLGPAGRGLLIGRLLEEGDGAELRWLAATVGREAIAAFVAGHGGRQLSRRSRAFWSRLLAVTPAAAPALAPELWPLA